MEPNRNFNRGCQRQCHYNQGTSVRYTGQAGTCQSGLIQPRATTCAAEPGVSAPCTGAGKPVGMAYIPEQTFENLYDAKCGLAEGTMFKDLNLIFCGVRGKA